MLEQLSSTIWDADLLAVRQDRDVIAAAVQVDVSAFDSKAATDQPKVKKADALDSYQHLVDEVGY